jgi:hypothetical protein
MFDGAGMSGHESEVFLFLHSLLLQQQTVVFPFRITKRSGNNLQRLLSFRYFSRYPDARKNYVVCLKSSVNCIRKQTKRKIQTN